MGASFQNAAGLSTPQPAGKSIPKYARPWRAYFGGVGGRRRCRAARSEAGRHVKWQIGDAVLDLDVLRMQHIGNVDVLPVLLAALAQRTERVVLAALDLYGRDVLPPPDLGLGDQEIHFHPVLRLVLALLHVSQIRGFLNGTNCTFPRFSERHLIHIFDQTHIFLFLVFPTKLKTLVVCQHSRAVAQKSRILSHR